MSTPPARTLLPEVPGPIRVVAVMDGSEPIGAGRADSDAAALLRRVAMAAATAAREHPGWKDGVYRMVVIVDDGDPRGTAGIFCVGYDGPGQLADDLLGCLESAVEQAGGKLVVVPGSPN